jgi:CBS domain-containing protein
MKAIKVKEVYKLQGRASTSVAEEAALDYIVALLGHEPSFQGIFFIDSAKRFTGMITRFDLLRHFRLNDIKPKEEVLNEFLSTARRKKAKDLQLQDLRSYSVKENDTIQLALDLMLKFEKDIIPVVDDGGAILGDLSLSEVLLKALEFDTNSATKVDLS